MGTQSLFRAIRFVVWLVVAGLGAGAYAVVALARQEPLNSGYLLVAALCTYAIGYRFYSKWIAAKVLALDDRRATPCEVHDDGKDYVRTNKWIVFGHHFAAISGPGPLVGPVLAAQFGYLPGTLWMLIGVVLGGAVQDMVILFASMRRDGRSLAQMVRDELNSTAGAIGMVAILAILTILLAVLALVVVNVLAESPWGVFTVGATIPIAMFMGGYLRFLRVGKVMEVSVIGVVLLLLAVWGGKMVYADTDGLAKVFKLSAEPLAWSIIVYGLAASVLPVWLLLAPRDYLSTFMKLGTIFLLAIGTLLVLPDLKMPALSKFVDGSGLVVPGKLFPFCFITIACGAISGFHTLVASGITPKIITRESYARMVGYGAMCLESLVAMMAMIAACTLDPGVYLAMNVKGVGPDRAAQAADIQAKVERASFFYVEPPKRQPDGSSIGRSLEVKAQVNHAAMEELAREVGEDSLYGRTGGAATLAVGMACIFSELTKGRWLDLWYHFAIMFEALFILTTIDAGTRVGRYLLQDLLGKIRPSWGEMRRTGPNLLASSLFAAGWGFFLIQGVRDPEGGVKALWPVFGIANQMLAAIALCLAVTIILKMQLQRRAKPDLEPSLPRTPWLALVVMVPLAWLLAVTLTASSIKVFHPKPGMGFWATARAMDEALPGLEQQLAEARARNDAGAATALQTKLKETRTLRFNNRVDAVVTGSFLVLVVTILGLSIREWIKLLAGRKEPALTETKPVWLPEAAVAEGKPVGWLGYLALALMAAKEISGEAAFERARQTAQTCRCAAPPCPCRGEAGVAGAAPAGHECAPAAPPPGKVLEEVLENRYGRGINRCC